MGQEVSSLGGSDVDQLRMLMNLAQLEQGLRQHPAGETSQADHAWDSDDCSPNLTLTQDGRFVSGRFQRILSIYPHACVTEQKD